MSKKRIFRGVATALITPFKDGKIDYPALEKIIEMQIRAKIDALVVGGTTGEVATLSDAERREMYGFAAGVIKGRTKLIFGTGTNDTRKALEHTALACEIGCDGILVVTPYYNKGTSDGLRQHYTKIADTSTVPLIIYNVPSRTGVNLSLGLVRELSEHQNIVGIKEANDSASRLCALSALTDNLALYSGNDNLTYTTLALGGDGVISVLSNAYPDKMREICELYFTNMGDESRIKQNELLKIIDAIFIETNPAPIKYLMSKMGFCENELRLPLERVELSSEMAIERALKELGV